MKSKTPKWMTWKKNYPGRHLHPLDVLILKFLWKWKVSTIFALREAIAFTQNHNTFNKRIRKLEHNGLIECERVLFPGMNLWQLTEHGTYVLRESLGAIQDEGFRSASPLHDALVLAFQMGEWIWRKDKPLFITDQELLRYPKDYWHKALPKNSDHRPDGYTLVEREGLQRVLAFEVELHAKAVSRYKSLIAWYDLMREVERIFWLVGDDYIIDQFKKGKAEARSKNEQLHLFIELNEYLKSGWDAVCTTERSEKVGTLREILGLHMGQESGDHLGSEGYKPNFSIFTDQRKFLSLSEASADFLLSMKI